MLDVGIKETTATTGTGTVTLSAVANHVRVSDAFGVGDLVSYCLTSGNGDKEWGIGAAAASNTLERLQISATLVGSTYARGSSAISLTGTSEVIVTPHIGGYSASDSAIATPFATHVFAIGAIGGQIGSTFAFTANRMYAQPLIPKGPTSGYSGIGILVTTAVAGTAYIGIAESVNDGGKFKPGRLIGQGSVDLGTTGWKAQTAFAPRLMPGHVYWLMVSASSAATIRGIEKAVWAPVLGYDTGAPPNPFTWCYAANTGSIPTDLSSTSFTYAGSGSTAIYAGLTT